MHLPTVVGPEPAAVEHRLPHRPPASRVLNPLTYGVILFVACVCGIVAIVGSHPFASMSATERISEAVGQPASCTEVGVAVLTAKSTAVYRCNVGSGKHSSSRCFAVAGEQVQQISSSARRLRC
jgi:hypothetical protein